jgi:hypothetical protein
MANRREELHDYYRRLAAGGTLLEKAASAGPSYQFHGSEIVHAVVTRTDLNGYSSWARGRPAAERAAQLDTFFSLVVPQIEHAGGVFFRDEGDCIVALYSDYFGRGATYDSVERYCMNVSRPEYGRGQLSAKTCVGCGDVAVFQKQHEVANGDWSAEGEPFVRAARLEQSVASIKHIVFLKEDYDQYFAKTTNVGTPDQRPAWLVENESSQVAGLGATGGWVDIVRLEFTT